MASKRHQRRKVCGNKVQHKTRDEAWFHMKRLQVNKGCKNLGIYKCKFCKQWHVGHVPSGVVYQIKEAGRG